MKSNNIRTTISSMSKKLGILYNDQIEAKAVIEELFMHHLKAKRILLYSNEIDLELNEAIIHIEKDFHRLLKQEPIQYIIGKAYFRELELNIGQGVLIPRPETEELIEFFIQKEKPETKKLKILDACTGSGCIAISLKKEYPELSVSAFDFSPKALSLAKSNAKTYNTEINIFHYDLFSDHQSTDSVNYDIVISNPPYVLESEKTQIAERVKSFEPEAALYVPDNDPLRFYKKIIEKFTSQNTRFYFEINPLSLSYWIDYSRKKSFQIEIQNDLSAKERFIRIK